MGLYNAAGTRLAKSSFPAAAESDPVMVVSANVHGKRPYLSEDGDATEGSETYVAFHAGQKIRQSDIDGQYPAATVAAITPATGATAGGTAVTITGDNLDGVTEVTFGGSAGTSVTVVNPTTLTVTTPAHAGGAVAVVLTDDSGATTVAAGFTYS